MDLIFQQNNIRDEIEINEIQKIISIAFYNLGMRQKAKVICPEIKDDFQIEQNSFEIIQIKKDNININKNNNL